MLSRRALIVSALSLAAGQALAQDAAPQPPADVAPPIPADKPQDLMAPQQAPADVPPPPAAAPGVPRTLTDDEKAQITDIDAHNSAIKTMVGRFLQVDTQGQRIEGTFFLQRPSKILFRYNPPSYEQIISVGRGFYVVDRKERTQYAYPQDKVPLRQFLDENIDLLKSNIVGIAHSPDYLTVVLQDDTPAGIVKVALVFDTESKDLKQWTLTEPSGSELTFSLYDVQFGVDIPNSMFYIDPTFRPAAAPKEG